MSKTKKNKASAPASISTHEPEKAFGWPEAGVAVLKSAPYAVQVYKHIQETWTRDDLQVHVQDSYLRDGQHIVSLNFHNPSKHATYLEEFYISGVDIELPSRSSANRSIATRPPEPSDPKAPRILPMLISSGGYRDMQIAFAAAAEIPEQKHHWHYVGRYVFSNLGEAGEREGIVILRRRWKHLDH